ncbi:hypothetical protein ACHHYP_20525, partial [Achlya hypogyna]
MVAVVEKAFKTALLSAVSRGDATKVASVLADGISADCVLEDGRSLLHVATALGITEVMLSLISADANIGETPLHVAVRSGRKAIVQMLVDSGADCDMVNQDRLTPMALAEMLGLHDIQSFLRAHTRPADFELVTAVISRDADLVRELLARRGNPNATDEAGQTLLHLAILGDAQNILMELLQSPDIDLGDLPLVTAIKLGRRSFAKLIFAAIHQPTRKVRRKDVESTY